MPSGVIKINPAVMTDGRSALAVAVNEALRLWMEDNNYEPETVPTEAQQAALAGTAYSEDPEAMSKTVLARIATGDESAPDPTPEQIEEVRSLLEMVASTLEPDDPDQDMLEQMMENLGGGEEIAEVAPEEGAEMPPEETMPVAAPEMPLEEGSGEAAPIVPDEMPEEQGDPPGEADFAEPELPPAEPAQETL